METALDLLEELTGKYQRLLLAVAGPIIPTIIYDWKTVFREPWILGANPSVGNEAEQGRAQRNGPS